MNKQVEIQSLDIGDKFIYVGFTYELCNKYSTWSDAKMLLGGKIEHFGNTCYVQLVEKGE